MNRIEFESFDDVKLPLTVKGGTTIIELGEVQPEKEAFHSKAYIYPLGFERYISKKSNIRTKEGLLILELHSIKKLGSIVNENATTVYHSKIEDAGGNPKYEKLCVFNDYMMLTTIFFFKICCLGRRCARDDLPQRHELGCLDRSFETNQEEDRVCQWSRNVRPLGSHCSEAHSGPS